MKYYCFLWQRQIDSQAWPSIFTNKEQAENYIERVSPVVEIELEVTLPVLPNRRPHPSLTSKS